MRPPVWDIKTRNAVRLFGIAFGAILLRLFDGIVTRLVGVVR